MEGKTSREVIIQLLKLHLTSIERTISEFENVKINTPDGVNRLLRVTKDMILALEGKRECNGNGRYLDCTCPWRPIYNREEACKPCRGREIDLALMNECINPSVIKSQLFGPVICDCIYCICRCGEYPMLEKKFLSTADEKKLECCKICNTKVPEYMCIDCFLRFTADLIHQKKL
jgi:hypothetical protein